MVYPRNTTGTTLDGLLDAVADLNATLKIANAASVDMCGKLEAIRVAIVDDSTAQVAEMKKQTAILQTISDQLKKGLLVQSVAKL